MSRIFLSHSSANDAEAVALHDWLKGEGWDDIFLDTDPDRGIAAGERWERALNKAANRCEAVLFLVSQAWLNSGWCQKEFNLAQRLNKRLFGVLIEDIAVAALPVNLTATWQMVNLAVGGDNVTLRASLPITGDVAHVTFATEGLARLKHGLQRAGLDPRFFEWPPRHDPDRAPYRGMLPLEADDAGIFFGREAPIIEALDRLRGLLLAASPRLLVILGASGAGKSSFLRAGLLPRLSRDDRNFLPLPVVRSQRAAINGDTGFLHALETAARACGLALPRDVVKAAVDAGAAGVSPLLRRLSDNALATRLDTEQGGKPPAFVLPIDQGEELFAPEGAAEAEQLLTIVRDLLVGESPDVLVLITMRSDSFERLQSAKLLDGINQSAISLPPMPQGAYQAVIEGPAARLHDTKRALAIEPALTQALLADMEAGGGRDALPLLSFTLERLYLEYGGSGHLKLADYEALGRIGGSIEAAVERAFSSADADSAVPKDRAARLALLRRGLIPWLAGIDPDTGAPRRRVARLSEIPAEARPLIGHLIDERLLAVDVAQDTGENTIEPAHEALLRQWGLLKGWLAEDAGLLAVLEGVKRASRDWAANNRDPAWLIHANDHLAAAERLTNRPDLAANLEPTDRNYLAACRAAESLARSRKRRVQALIYILLLGIIGGLLGWINQSYLISEVHWYATVRPYMLKEFRPHVLSARSEKALKPADTFRECSEDCPEMVVIPAGSFTMGSFTFAPPHTVTIGAPLAVARYEVTFAQWDACYAVGACPKAADSGMGRGSNPVINVSWDDANQYVAWLSLMTGKSYRLLSETEYEYATRGGTQTAYYWGDQIGINNANCAGCRAAQDQKRPVRVGTFPPNPFGLYDMSGNVWEWVADCYHETYAVAPADGSAWMSGNCGRHIIRGGSWQAPPHTLRSEFRYYGTEIDRWDDRGFRIARTLDSR